MRGIKYIIAILLIGNFLLFSNELLAQYTNQQIDSLNRAEGFSRKDGNWKKLDSIYHILLENAKKNGYTKGVINQYIGIANVQILLVNYTSSNRYLDSAEVYIKEIDDPLVVANFYATRGRIYYCLELLDLSLENFEMALSASSGISDDSGRNKTKTYIYEYQSLALERDHQFDSALAKAKMALHTFPKPITACRLARLYLKHFNNFDSARWHLDLARKLLEADRFRFDTYSQSLVSRVEGLYYFEQGDYKKAIDFYNQSISLSRLMFVKKDELVTNKLLHAAYTAINDTVGMTTTMQRYTILMDSVSSEEKQAVDIAVADLLAKKENSSKDAVVKVYIQILLLAFAAFTVLFFVIKRYRQKIRKKENQLKQQEQQIEATTKKQELLSKMVNESYDEVVKLAKSNSPDFFTRFWEVYPQLKARLFNINPNLRASELALCAYIYLNFSTREIADFTFKSARTIQTQKSDLRKRLAIASQQDLYSWMQQETTIAS